MRSIRQVNIQVNPSKKSKNRQLMFVKKRRNKLGKDNQSRNKK